MPAPPDPTDEHQHYNSIEQRPPQSALGSTSVGWIKNTINKMTRRNGSEEGAPLLFKTPSRASQKLVEVEMVRDEIEDNKGAVYKYEFLRLLRTSAPVIFAYMLQNSLQTGSILVAGRMVFVLEIVSDVVGL